MVTRRTGDGLDLGENLLRSLAIVVPFTCYLCKPEMRFSANDNLLPEALFIGANESTIVEKNAIECERDLFQWALGAPYTTRASTHAPTSARPDFVLFGWPNVAVVAHLLAIATQITFRIGQDHVPISIKLQCLLGEPEGKQDRWIRPSADRTRVGAAVCFLEGPDLLDLRDPMPAAVEKYSRSLSISFEDAACRSWQRSRSLLLMIVTSLNICK